MKHKFISLVVVAVCSVGVLAAIPVAAQPDLAGGAQVSSGPQPKLLVENPVFDFGSATEGTMVRHVFKIKNQGQARLVITGVKTSCGCTTGAPTKSNLAPGEDAEISVGFDTRFQKGHQVRVITAYTNDPANPQAQMTIEGTVRQQVAATPAQVAFGRVKKGTELTREVEIQDLTGGKNFEVSEVSNSNKNIKVTQLPAAKGKTGVKLKVDLLKTMPVGGFDDSIRVTTNRVPLQIDVFGTVTGDLTLDPAQVSFGIVAHGADAVRILRLTNESSRDVKITGVTSDNAVVSASADPVKPGKEYKITVQLARGTPDGQVRGQLQVKTDDPDQQVVIVPFYGIVGEFKM